MRSEPVRPARPINRTNENQVLALTMALNRAMVVLDQCRIAMDACPNCKDRFRQLVDEAKARDAGKQ
jgi:hypothetical protein